MPNSGVALRACAGLSLWSAVAASPMHAQAPSLRLDFDVSNEGGVGERRTIDFSVSLSATSSQVVTVNYAISNGASNLPAATGGAACTGTVDYIAAAGTLTFPAGTVTRPVPVTICGDAAFETDERLTITLSAPTNATIASPAVVGTIVNDDPRPLITVTMANQAMVTEGTGGTTSLPVTVAISTPNHYGASLKLVRGGTARRGAQCAGNIDVQASSDTISVSWPPNNSDHWSVPIVVCGDQLDEDNDTVELTAVLVVNADVAPGNQMRRAVIFDDDPTPVISVASVSIVEGTVARLGVTLSAPSDRDVTVTLSAAAGTSGGITAATAGASCTGTIDFIPANRIMTVPAGRLTSSQSLDITTCTNADFSNNPATLPGPGYTEVFLATALSPVNATLGTSVGVVTIRDP